MNIFEASYGIGGVCGAAIGGMLGYEWFNWIGSLAGVLVGAVVGGFTAPFLVFGMFMVGIFWESGMTELREVFHSSHDTEVGESQSAEGSKDAEPAAAPDGGA